MYPRPTLPLPLYPHLIPCNPCAFTCDFCLNLYPSFTPISPSTLCFHHPPQPASVAPPLSFPQRHPPPPCRAVRSPPSPPAPSSRHHALGNIWLHCGGHAGRGMVGARLSRITSLKLMKFKW
ncbi:hypothetical protein E2C01_018345 [Portunus trituberculatus]|uniref:Uncharacterized protein n=1 Tax=Portunus trituberculatus TaxID=210409 RepID=A0A5B7DUT1_PORTR|nr:hypothetical protein [Portunus trituberculatus]